MDTLLKQIIRSPKLPFYLKELQKFYEEEQKRRKQFYDEVTEDQKAEFIMGEVILHSPVKYKHIVASDNLFSLLSIYTKANALGSVRHEKVMIRLTRNDFEPDISFFGNEKAKQFTKNQMLFPAPDFVVEVLSDSTEKNDRGVKFEDYALHEVAEYWLVDPEKEIVEQYFLEKGKYALNIKSAQGNIVSQAIEGFEIPIRAIFDEKANLLALQKILNG